MKHIKKTKKKIEGSPAEERGESKGTESKEQAQGVDNPTPNSYSNMQGVPMNPVDHPAYELPDPTQNVM